MAETAGYASHFSLIDFQAARWTRCGHNARLVMTTLALAPQGYRAPVVTGRSLVQGVLREPMESLGWRRRAAGWFTAEVAPGYLGAVAVGTATKHAAPGTSLATLYVHLRDERVEPVVAELCGMPDAGYKTTTATTSIGYLMPEASWKEWLVAPDTAAVVATEMAAAVQQHAVPYLAKAATDPRLLLDAISLSAAYSTATGFCRAAVLLARNGERQAAGTLIDERVTAAEGRADAAAQKEREVAEALRRWLQCADH